MKKSYSENPMYFKQLIARINEEANFPAYLVHLGYALRKKSAGSMEFDHGEDRVVLQLGRNPVTYFNRNDSTDKGLFFGFIRKRHPNFYHAIEMGLEIIDRAYEVEGTFLRVHKKAVPSKSLEETYTIVPLQKMDYLTGSRGISKASINDELFKGRIYNAFHRTDAGGKIANIAFPKYDLADKPKNYILYNKEYFDRTENRRKKFRLVLNKRDHFLFYSKKLPIPKTIVVGESGIDLLSYHELHGSPENFYISFGGNIYSAKLAFFKQLIATYVTNDHIRFTSIFDNDKAGREFDLKLLTALVNGFNPKVAITHHSEQGTIQIILRYPASSRTQIPKAKAALEHILASKGLTSGLVQIVGFADKLLIGFDLDRVSNTEQEAGNGTNGFKIILESLGSMYLPFGFGLHESEGKDWNDDLRDSKRTQYVALTTVVPKSIDLGDKVGLKSGTGPENSKNEGIVIAIQKMGVVCDFGLKHSYRIPYSAIKTHYQKVRTKSPDGENAKRKKAHIKLSIS